MVLYCFVIAFIYLRKFGSCRILPQKLNSSFGTYMVIFPSNFQIFSLTFSFFPEVWVSLNTFLRIPQSTLLVER